MKVSKLEKGMMLKPAEDGASFSISEWDGSWLRVINKKQRKAHFLAFQEKRYGHAIYLGTKSDVAEYDVKWSNRFVLCGGKVVAVDPYSWRKIEESHEKINSR